AVAREESCAQRTPALSAVRCPPFTILSLLQQRANLIEVLALIARLVAAVQVANVALAIDEYGARHRAHLVHLTDLAVLVEQHGERDRRLRKPAFSILRVCFHVHAEQREAKRTVTNVNLNEKWHVLATGPAPARPEVDHDDLALQLLERDHVATSRRQREARCDRAARAHHRRDDESRRQCGRANPMLDVP